MDTRLQMEMDLHQTRQPVWLSYLRPSHLPTPPVELKTVIIPRVDPKQLNEWQLVQNSKHGLIEVGALKPDPTSLYLCELEIDAGDEHSLKYMFAESPNYYKVLVWEYADEATSLDVDIEIQIDGTAIDVYTADSGLLDLRSAKVLMDTHHHNHKVEHMSAQELTKTIDDYMLNHFGPLHTNHEDVLGAIKAQPAYHRRLFQLNGDEQQALLKARLQKRYGSEPPPLDVAFEHMFLTDQDRDNAFQYALVDLLFMVMAPSIYLDPLKIQMLIPPQLEPRRICYSALLLWSDITLVYTAQTGVFAVFLQHQKISTHVKTAIEAVKTA
uniref:Uncharacterized protein n=1 Tax=Globisporangium ultimum (strain ATCC 200006 / CBS 805.95 / DAOM BR144) TaxID=431595 RepID=K3X958_GLOUD